MIKAVVSYSLSSHRHSLSLHFILTMPRRGRSRRQPDIPTSDADMDVGEEDPIVDQEDPDIVVDDDEEDMSESKEDELEDDEEAEVCPLLPFNAAEFSLL